MSDELGVELARHFAYLASCLPVDSSDDTLEAVAILKILASGFRDVHSHSLLLFVYLIDKILDLGLHPFDL